MLNGFMANKTLDKKVENLSQNKRHVEGKEYVSFAEQYLEKPVFEGEGVKNYEMAKFTATACTYRGIPIWDDF